MTSAILISLLIITVFQSIQISLEFINQSMHYRQVLTSGRLNAGGDIVLWWKQQAEEL